MKLLTRKEAAQRLRVHEVTIDRYIRRGVLEAVKMGGLHGPVRIPEQSLLDYVEQHTVRARP